MNPQPTSSDQIPADEATSPGAVSSGEPLLRQLGPVSLWMLVINGMIGGGIFGVPAEAESLAGAFSPWVFVICALLIAPIMLCFMELSSAFSGTGGPMLYARVAFGPFVGFQVGWAFYIARLTAFAANLNLLVTTLGFFWPSPLGPAVRIGMFFLLCSLMVWVNIVGARAAMQSLGALTLLKLLPLIALAFVGLIGLDRGIMTSALSPPAVPELAAAVLLVIYAFVGFESGLVPAGESRNPQRDMPRALIGALAVVTAIYVFVQIGAQRLLPDLASSDRPLVEAGQVLMDTWGAMIVILAIIGSVGGNLVGSMFSTPRVTYRMALDGQLPAVFSRIHPKHQTPWISVVVYGAAAFLLAATGSFVWLAVLSVCTRLLIYLTCIAAMPRVRAATVDSPDRLRLPGWWIILLVALAVCVVLLTGASLASVLATAALLAVGTVLLWIAALTK